MLTCERVDEAANSEGAAGDLAWMLDGCRSGMLLARLCCASWLREPDFAFENREEVHAQDRRPPAHVRKRDLESAKLEQAAEMERRRMDFTQELESQRVQFFLNTQMELTQAKNHASPATAAVPAGGSSRRISVVTDVGGSSNHHSRYRISHGDRHRHAPRPHYQQYHDNNNHAVAGAASEGEQSDDEEDDYEEESQ